MTWKASSGKSPYGRPSPKGNADLVWRLSQRVPCPTCGATAKRVVIVKDRAIITCGAS